MAAKLVPGVLQYRWRGTWPNLQGLGQGGELEIGLTQASEEGMIDMSAA
jgi:hypothetical protein